MYTLELNILSQNTFRRIMRSMAFPGKVVSIHSRHFSKISENEKCLFAICSALLDNETTFSLIGNGVNEALIDEIYTFTKARYTSIEQADYLVVYGGSDGRSLSGASKGDLLFPDKGATVFYKVSSFSGNDAVKLELSGPGIENTVEVSICGILRGEIEMIKIINSEYPLGIDIIFFDDQDNIVCVPRSTKIEIKDN